MSGWVLAGGRNNAKNPPSSHGISRTQERGNNATGRNTAFVCRYGTVPRTVKQSTVMLHRQSGIFFFGNIDRLLHYIIRLFLAAML